MSMIFRSLKKFYELAISYMVWMTQQVLKSIKTTLSTRNLKLKWIAKIWTKNCQDWQGNLTERAKTKEWANTLIIMSKEKNLCRPVNCGITYDCKYCHCLTQISRCTSIDARSGSRSNKYDCKWKKYSPCESVNLPNRFWFKVLIHVLNIIYLKQ